MSVTKVRNDGTSEISQLISTVLRPDSQFQKSVGIYRALTFNSKKLDQTQCWFQKSVDHMQIKAYTHQARYCIPKQLEVLVPDTNLQCWYNS